MQDLVFRHWYWDYWALNIEPLSCKKLRKRKPLFYHLLKYVYKQLGEKCISNRLDMMTHKVPFIVPVSIAGLTEVHYCLQRKSACSNICSITDVSALYIYFYKQYFE